MPCSAVKKKNQILYSFQEARKIARHHGFETEDEFLEYDCPGAYQLPKNPEAVWSNEWKGYDDFLGICWEFQEGRQIARALNLASKEEYLELFEHRKIQDDHPASRLPYRPDLKYKTEWIDWKDWLFETYSSAKLKLSRRIAESSIIEK
jgi:hypothetical protein